MKICPNCGAHIKDGADVCDKCGALSGDLQDLLDELAGNKPIPKKEEKKPGSMTEELPEDLTELNDQFEDLPDENVLTGRIKERKKTSKNKKKNKNITSETVDAGVAGEAIASDELAADAKDTEAVTTSAETNEAHGVEAEETKAIEDTSAGTADVNDTSDSTNGFVADEEVPDIEELLREIDEIEGITSSGDSADIESSIDDAKSEAPDIVSAQKDPDDDDHIESELKNAMTVDADSNKEKTAGISRYREEAKKNYEDYVIPYEDGEKPAPKRGFRIFITALIVFLLAASMAGGYAYYNNNIKKKQETKIAEEKKKEEEKAKKEEQAKAEEEKAKAEEEAKAKKEAEAKAQEEAEAKAKAEAEAKAKAEAEAKAKEEAEAKAKAEEAAMTKQQADANQQSAYNGTLGTNIAGVNTTPNADGTYSDDPGHMYEEDVAPGDARLYWVSDRTLNANQLQAVANKFGAQWTIGYIYAKHGYNISGYTKYGFTPDTGDRATAESRFNGAEKRNVTALTNY